MARLTMRERAINEIVMDVMANGKVGNAALRAYIESRISRATFDAAASRGMQMHALKAAASSFKARHNAEIGGVAEEGAIREAQMNTLREAAARFKARHNAEIGVIPDAR